MNIGIDARSTVGMHGGFYSYSNCLLEQFSLLETGHEFTLFFADKQKNFFGLNSRQIGFFRYPTLWAQLRLPVAAAKEKIDLLHSLCYPSPIVSGCKKVFSLHDLGFLRFPEFLPDKKTAFFWDIFSHASAKTADAIITDSASSKKDIIDFFHAKEKKVFVVPLAASDSFRQLSKTEKQQAALLLKKKFFLEPGFLLFVGTIEPRKNLCALVTAFNALKIKGLKKKLVIAGATGWKHEQLFELVKRLGLEKEIVFTGIVSEQELVALYNLAAVFVFPSFFEGFGLPVLEAMQCGCPVVAANNSSIPEITGSAAILFDAQSGSQLVESIETILFDNKKSENLVALGLEQAKKFSWKKTALQTVRVYEKTFK